MFFGILFLILLVRLKKCCIFYLFRFFRLIKLEKLLIFYWLQKIVHLQFDQNGRIQQNTKYRSSHHTQRNFIFVNIHSWWWSHKTNTKIVLRVGEND